jgi:putative transposase
MDPPLQNDTPPCRRNPSPGVHIHLDQSSIVLLTVTTKGRVARLANAQAHKLLHEAWLGSTAWLIGDYVIMPDHLHCFCAPCDIEVPIEKWIRYWKREFTLKHARSDWKFQSRGWHHRLRNDEKYAEKWLYVQENPVRKNLCKHIDGWPFKGRVFDLTWVGK